MEVGDTLNENSVQRLPGSKKALGPSLVKKQLMIKWYAHHLCFGLCPLETTLENGKKKKKKIIPSKLRFFVYNVVILWNCNKFPVLCWRVCNVFWFHVHNL